ncbi:MAG: transcription elongation factor GreA [Clostridia bacterium]|nr:transcription elongation factor GreA [Clostridia bacterium]
MADKKLLNTAEGLQKLKDRLKYLEGEATERNKAALAAARALGDLSENAEYDEAKDEQARIVTEIMELKAEIENTVIVEEGDASKVNLGCDVLVHAIDTDEDIQYSIVGSSDADPFARKISDQSPIGGALLGKKVGEEVEVSAPMGAYKLRILSISKSKKSNA